MEKHFTFTFMSSRFFLVCCCILILASTCSAFNRRARPQRSWGYMRHHERQRGWLLFAYILDIRQVFLKEVRGLWAPVSVGTNPDQAQESLLEAMFGLSLDAWALFRWRVEKRGKTAGRRTAYVRALREHSIWGSKNESYSRLWSVTWASPPPLRSVLSLNTSAYSPTIKPVV